MGTAETTAGKPQLTWRVGDLSTGPHTLTITKLTEPRYGAALLTKLWLEAGGKWLPAPDSPGERSGRRILLLGDSLTVGWGSTETAATCNGVTAESQDSAQTYGALAAAALGADAQIIGSSGIGFSILTKQCVGWAA